MVEKIYLKFFMHIVYDYYDMTKNMLIFTFYSNKGDLL